MTVWQLTHHLTDSVVWAGSGQDLSLQNVLALRGIGAMAMLAQTLTKLNTQLLPNGGQGLL